MAGIVPFPHAIQMAWRVVVDHIPEGTRLPILSGPLRGVRWTVSHHGYYPTGPDSGPGVRDYGYLSGFYERHTQIILRDYLRRGDVFWDLGAHHGFFSLLAKHCGASVVAFEGDPKSVPWIVRNIPQAVVCAEYVNATTDWRRFPRPDVIKCDIDGGESEALLGLLQVYRPRVIYLATHGPIHDMFCRGLLEEHAYALATIEADGAILAVRND